MIVLAATVEELFPSHYDAHVEAWYKWKWLYERGLVDKAGVCVFGRNVGRRAPAIARY